MAPGEAVTPPSKEQRKKVKSIMQQRKKTPVATVKKSISTKNFTEKVLNEVKVSNTAKPRPRTSTSVPKKPSTPKLKEKKIVPLPGSIQKSVKKEHWKKRPKPAHSGVPVPEAMRKLLMKKFQDSDFSFQTGIEK